MSSGTEHIVTSLLRPTALRSPIERRPNWIREQTYTITGLSNNTVAKSTSSVTQLPRFTTQSLCPPAEASTWQAFNENQKIFLSFPTKATETLVQNYSVTSSFFISTLLIISNPLPSTLPISSLNFQKSKFECAFSTGKKLLYNFFMSQSCFFIQMYIKNCILFIRKYPCTSLPSLFSLLSQMFLFLLLKLFFMPCTLDRSSFPWPCSLAAPMIPTYRVQLGFGQGK